jgi:hypothetical protein
MAAYVQIIWGVLFLFSFNPTIKVMNGNYPINLNPIEFRLLSTDTPNEIYFQPLKSTSVDYNSTRSNK